MKDGLRFVDCDMHIMEPVDLLDKYLDKKFRDRVILPEDAQGKLKRGMIVIDGQPTSLDHELQQHRKRSLPKAKTETSQPLSGSRMAAGGYLNFAIERNYDAEAQIMGMELEGIALAVMFPPMGLSLIARGNMDPTAPGPLPSVQQLDSRVRRTQPGSTKVGGDAAHAGRKYGMFQIGSLCQRARCGGVVCPPQCHRRSFLVFQLLEPAF